MKHIEKYFAAIALKINELKTTDDAEQLATELKEIAHTLRKVRDTLGDYMDTDILFLTALDNDLEHYEGLAAKEATRAEAIIDEIEEEQADEEEHGTYQQQVQSTYSDGRL